MLDRAMEKTRQKLGPYEVLSLSNNDIFHLLRNETKDSDGKSTGEEDDRKLSGKSWKLSGLMLVYGHYLSGFWG